MIKHGKKSSLDKANVFANHLREVFQPNPNSAPLALEATVIYCLAEDYQLDLPIKKFSITEVKTAITKLKLKLPEGPRIRSNH